MTFDMEYNTNKRKWGTKKWVQKHLKVASILMKERN